MVSLRVQFWAPLLFLIYINDLHLAIKNSKFFHFADDTNLLNINNSPKKIQKMVNADLKILYKWLLANKISLNCDKTEIIFFHKPGENVPDLKIKMNGNRIFPSKNIKYLGMHLDESLNGAFHSEILTKKLKRANGMLCKARHYISSDELKTLYYAIFSSHLIYGCQIWGQVTNTFYEGVSGSEIRVNTRQSDSLNSKPAGGIVFQSDSLNSSQAAGIVFQSDSLNSKPAAGISVKPVE